MSAPFVPLDSLLHPPPDSAQVTTAGRLLGTDLCPPCPPFHECEPCPPDGLVFAGASGVSVRVDLPYPTPGPPDALAVGQTYVLTVQTSARTPLWLNGGWITERPDGAGRQTLSLLLQGLRATE